MAFGSTRVMATCAHNAQAVAVAAALCKDLSCRPRDLLEPTAMRRLQVELLRTGQHIPHVSPPDDRDLARDARVTASSSLKLLELPPTDGVVRLDVARAMLMPLRPGVVPEITFWAAADADVNLVVQLRTCSRDASFTPDEILDAQVVEVLAATVDQTARPAAAGAAAAVQSGERAAKGQATPTPGPELSVPTAAAGAAFREIRVRFDAAIESPRYAMVCFMPNPAVSLALSDVRVTGVLALRHTLDPKVSKSAVQRPPADIGVDTFEFWLPERRPGGRNLAMRFEPPIDAFRPDNVRSGPERPTSSANAWVADLADATPWLELSWPNPREVSRVTLCFDTDLDHPLESVLMGHPERVMPFCIRDCRIIDDAGRVLATIEDNHQTRRTVTFPSVRTSKLRIELTRPSPTIPASVFRVRVGGAH